MANNKGKLYVVPTLLGDDSPLEVLPPSILEAVNPIRVFIVENVRSARRYLRKLNPSFPIDDCTFFEIGKHANRKDFPSFLQPALEGKSITLLSEAGCPGVADPGAGIVALAHQKGIEAIPLVGPSSLLLALMASGMNGQQFTFHGYLPIDSSERKRQLQKLEADAHSNGTTHLFIEAPYRNQKLLESIVQTLQGHTSLCIACDLTLPTQFIQTQTITDWKKQLPAINKRPAVFLIGKT